MEIRRATTTAELIAAEHLFDGPVRPEWAGSFLRAPGHHLFLAHDEAFHGGLRPAGFVSGGVETVHPDKGREMFLYELGVDPAARRRGIGRALVRRLAALARERDCYGMWVGVDTGNDPASAVYRSAGAVPDGDFTTLAWDFGGGDGAKSPGQ